MAKVRKKILDNKNEPINSHRESDPFLTLLSPNPWLYFQEGYSVDLEEPVEALMAIGNGYLCLRGILEENPNGTRPGTFFAGVFDKGNAQTPELVNAPNPIFLRLYVNEKLLEPLGTTTLENRRILDMQQGLFYRETIFLDDQNRRLRVSSLRFASFVDTHLMVIRYCVTALDEDVTIQLEDAIDAGVTNRDTIAREKNSHFRVLRAIPEANKLSLLCQTINRKIHILYTTLLQVEAEPHDLNFAGACKRNVLSNRLNLHLQHGIPVILTKWIATHTSRNIDKEKIYQHATHTLEQALKQGFVACLNHHSQAWKQRWRFADVQISGDDRVQNVLRLNLYHLMIAGPVRDKNVSIGARTLTGEGYGGHVFWDTEIFALPFFIFTDPKIARHLLMYRYRRLGAARLIAYEHGFAGAMFPWESADTGRDVTPTLAVDFDGSVVRVKTMDMEHHITADVAYGCAMYVDWSGDEEFFLQYGAEILFETARFWASRVEFDRARKCRVIRFVVGPDEFHEEVDNNAYTNFMARWNLETAAKWYRRLKQHFPEPFEKLAKKLSLGAEEPDEWLAIAREIVIPTDEARQLIEQFDGYFQREDFRITKRGDNFLPVFDTPLNTSRIQQTQAIKQADVLMLHVLFPADFPEEWVKNNYAYYEPRTTHSSSLSPAIHAIVASQIGLPVAAWKYFLAALFVDINLIQKSAADGIHAASAGIIWQMVILGFGGVTLGEDGKLSLNPRLPRHWEKVAFFLHWKGDFLQVTLAQQQAELCWFATPSKKRAPALASQQQEQAQRVIEVQGRAYPLTVNQPLQIVLQRS